MRGYYELAWLNGFRSWLEVRRKPYPSDVYDEEWSLLAPYLTLLPEDAGQREHNLREVFNGLRYIVKTGAPWRRMPNDLPPWPAFYQQTQRWLDAGCFEALIDDLRMVLCLAAARNPEPSAAIIDSRPLRSAPESGERGEVETLAQTIQAVTQDSIEIAWVDQGYAGATTAQAAARHGIELKVVKLPETKRGFILLPRRWVVVRSFAWATLFPRLVKDYKRYAQTLAGLHLVGFATIMSKQAVALITGS